MISVTQRVSQARVEVGGQTIGEIGHGLLVLVCAERGDTEVQADKLLAKHRDFLQLQNVDQMLLGGQIAGGPLQLFLIYSQGNFIDCGADTPFLHIGEAKYGKPILVSGLRAEPPPGRPRSRPSPPDVARARRRPCSARRRDDRRHRSSQSP